MKTVGVMLREARVAKGISVQDVERATKIREKFILAIEEDDFSRLPSPSYAKGFVRNYAEFLGVPKERAMAFFRRQAKESSRTSLLPKGVADPLNTPFFHLTPGRFIGFLVAVLLAAFFLYLGGQYVRLNQPPTLSVSAPKNQTISTEQHIVVSGQTDSDSTVTINGISTIVRDDGSFYDQVALDPGVNKIVVTATSRYGKTATVTRDVGYQP